MDDYLPFSDDEFKGLDVSSAPEKLPEGFLTRADNCLVTGAHAGRGAALQTRPGLRAQLSAAMGLEIGSRITYRNSSSQNAVFVAGSTTTARIYKWVKGGTVPVVISPGGVFFDRSKVQMARLDSWIFITGAIDGKLYRTDLTTFEVATGLDTPTRTPAVTLTNKVLIAQPGALGAWQQDPLYDEAGFGDDMLAAAAADGNFQSGWTIAGGTDTVNILDANGEPCAEFDSAGESATSPALVPPKLVGTSTRYARIFKLGFEHAAEDTGSDDLTERIHYTLEGYDDEAATGAVVYDDNGGNDSEKAGQTPSIKTSRLYDLRGLAVEPAGLLLKFEQNDSHGGTYGTDVNRVTLVAPAQKLAVTTGTAGELVVKQGTVSTDEDLLLCGGLYVEHVFGAPQDFSERSQLILSLRPGAKVTGLRARLYFRDTDGGDRTYTNELTLLPSGTEASVDISTVDVAARSAFLVLGIELVDDVTVEGIGPGTGVTLFSLGAITEAGSLSVGWSDYDYRITETKGAGTSFLESGTGPVSAQVTPTASKAQTDLVLSAGGTFPENTGATIRFWRRGGVPEVGDFFRILAEVDPTTDSTGEGWIWDASERTLRDNVPDQALFNADTLSEHIPPPTGAIAVAVFAGRLALGTSDGLYLSQQVVGAGVGLYYQAINDPLAPDYSTQGFYTRVSGNEGASSGDSIQRLIPYLSRLWIFFQNSIFTFSGRGPADFSLRRFEADGGKGCISPQALVVYDQVIWTLASDGLRVCDGQTFTRVSGRIESLLNPEAVLSGTALDAAAYAKASLVAHAGRLYLSVPLPGETTIGATFVLDSRAGGEWVRWLLGAITGGFTFEGSADVNDLYLTNTGGQIFRIGAAYGDTATLAGGVSPVTMTAQGRKFVLPGQQLQAQRFSATLDCEDATSSASLTVFADNEPAGRTWTQAYSLLSGETNIDRLKVPSQVRGRGLQWRIAATTTQPMILRKVQLLASVGASL
ncbi:MAG: hypothetical protein V4671_25645 [Armatimonadota bacterium]